MVHPFSRGSLVPRTVTEFSFHNHGSMTWFAVINFGDQISHWHSPLLFPEQRTIDPAYKGLIEWKSFDRVEQEDSKGRRPVGVVAYGRGSSGTPEELSTERKKTFIRSDTRNFSTRVTWEILTQSGEVRGKWVADSGWPPLGRYQRVLTGSWVIENRRQGAVANRKRNGTGSGSGFLSVDKWLMCSYFTVRAWCLPGSLNNSLLVFQTGLCIFWEFLCKGCDRNSVKIFKEIDFG